jgi:hypothetical protein
MSELKLDKFKPSEDLNPVCEICKGMHKTSHHEEIESERKVLLNPVCEVCRGPHKTSQHDLKSDKINEVK